MKSGAVRCIWIGLDGGGCCRLRYVKAFFIHYGRAMCCIHRRFAINMQYYSVVGTSQIPPLPLPQPYGRRYAGRHTNGGRYEYVQNITHRVRVRGRYVTVAGWRWPNRPRHTHSAHTALPELELSNETKLRHHQIQ